MFYSLSLTPQEGYTLSKPLENAILKQIESISNQSYSVRKKWNIMEHDGENYMCKIAQNKNVYLGCFVNVKSILEPFIGIAMGNGGYVLLVDREEHIVGELANGGVISSIGKQSAADPYTINRTLA
ncbi:histidine kinase, partial [Lachnospiraceae bacterium OttesenSCG-928-D06]|nr:histidine kinase [Lachnospiraceae bacterium OttesenSCG-928-D06]